MLVVLKRTTKALSMIPVANIKWQERGSSAQPERALVVRDGRVIGFGDLDGPAGIHLENGQFVLSRKAFSLSESGHPDAAAKMSAWVFGASGACMGFVQREEEVVAAPTV
jgi:hypothetical protein